MEGGGTGVVGGQEAKRQGGAGGQEAEGGQGEEWWSVVVNIPRVTVARGLQMLAPILPHECSMQSDCN